MTDPSKERDATQSGIGRDSAVSKNGSLALATASAARYCAFCGRGIEGEGLPERFGERFCSESHAGELVKGVRAGRVQAAPSALPEAPRAAEATPQQPATGAATSANWKMALKMAVCCGAPMLALVVLAGGGGALLGAASAVLPLLLLLACPLGMFSMMRGMGRMGRQDKGTGEEDRK